MQNKAEGSQPSLEALRHKYIERLTARCAQLVELEAGLAAAQGGEPQLDSELAELSHKLAGSGATYGFPDISEAARRLEDALPMPGSPAGRQEVLALCRELRGVCERAVEAGATAAEEELDDELAWAADAAAEKALLKPRTLLTVDDDKDVRDLVRSLFDADAEVWDAESAEAARILIERKKPDVILLDERMPGMSGVAFLEELSRISAAERPYVIMLTADRESKSVMRALAAGAVDYLVKPVSPERLRDRVGSILKHVETAILIADDDSVLRDLLASKFRATGMKVHTARSGTEALEQAAKEKYALVILDRMMPGMDGLAVLKKMRQTYGERTPPVIFLTARRQEQDVLEGLKEGALDYVVKPFVPEEVVLRAMHVIEQTRRRKDG